MSNRAAKGVLLAAVVLAPCGVAQAVTEGPVQVAKAIATTCNEKRYSDVGAYLHSSLRSRWAEMGYRVTEYCKSITHGFTLQAMEIRAEEQVGPYSVVDLTYIYSDGTRKDDRALFVEEAGVWRLTT